MVTVETDDHHEVDYGRHLRDSGLRPVNFRFLTIAVATLVTMLGIVHGLHEYQLRRMGSHLLKQAEEASAAGQPNEAIRHLRSYLLIVPDDSEASEKLAFALTDVAETGKQRFEAFLLLERILKDDPAEVELRRRLVDLLILSGRFTDAIEHLQLLLAKAPNNDQLHLLMARSYVAIRDDGKAAASFENAIRCAPRTFRTYEELAELLGKQRDGAENARNVMDRMVASGPSAPEASLARARFCQSKGEVEAAESDAIKALQFGPADPDVLQFVAELIASTGNRHNKFNVNLIHAGLIRALEQDSSDVGLMVGIAQLDAHLGRYDLAEQRLRKAIQDNTKDLQLGWRLAEMLISQSKLEEARLEMARLGDLKLARPLQEYLAARIEMMDGHWLDAVRKFESVRNSPASVPTLLPQVHLCLGHCYENLGHVEQQLAAYREATNLNESSEEARLGLARSLARIGRTDDALLHYAQVRHLSGVSIQIARLLLQRNLQRPAAERNWNDVEEALDIAAKTDLENSLVVRSFMLVAQNQAPQALELLERAIERHPGHVGLRVALAETHYQMGSISQAESVMVAAEQTLGNRVEILLARIRYAAALTGDAAKVKLLELEESATRFSGAAQLNVWRALAAAAAAIGDTDRWRIHVTAVAEKNPDDLQVIHSLYFGALQSGSTDDAERWLQEIRRIDGNDGPETLLAEAQRLMVSANPGPTDKGAVEHGAVEHGAVEQARELFNKVAVQMPGSPRVALELAQLETLAGNEDLAIDHYTKAIDAGENDPEVFNRLIRLLYKQRRFTEAADVVERLRNTATVSLTGDLGRVAAEVSIRSQDLKQASRFAELAVSSESPDFRDHLWPGQISLPPLAWNCCIPARQPRSSFNRFSAGFRQRSCAIRIQPICCFRWGTLPTSQGTTPMRKPCIDVPSRKRPSHR